MIFEGAGEEKGGVKGISLLARYKRRSEDVGKLASITSYRNFCESVEEEPDHLTVNGSKRKNGGRSWKGGNQGRESPIPNRSLINKDVFLTTGQNRQSEKQDRNESTWKCL